VRGLCDPEFPDDDVGGSSRNLLKRGPHPFDFVRDARAPWHSDARERAMRAISVEHWMSGGMRSEAGARTHPRLKSVSGAAQRKGQNFLQTVEVALARALPSWRRRGAPTVYVVSCGPIRM